MAILAFRTVFEAVHPDWLPGQDEFRTAPPANFPITDYTPLSAVLLLVPYQLDELWLAVWRELWAKQEVGAGDTRQIPATAKPLR